MSVPVFLFFFLKLNQVYLEKIKNPFPSIQSSSLMYGLRRNHAMFPLLQKGTFDSALLKRKWYKVVFLDWNLKCTWSQLVAKQRVAQATWRMNQKENQLEVGPPLSFMERLRDRSWQAEDVYWQTRGRALTEDMFTKWHRDEWALGEQTGYMCRFDKRRVTAFIKNFIQ